MKKRKIAARDMRIIQYLNNVFGRDDAAQILVDAASGFNITPQKLCRIIAQHKTLKAWGIK